MAEFPCGSRKVVITHGGRGLGPTVARRFASAGARVVIVDEDDKAGTQTMAVLRAEGMITTYRRAHIVDLQSAHRFIDDLVQGDERVDVWINGLRDPGVGALPGSPLHAWDAGLAGLSQTLYCSQAIAEHMQQSGGGVIVNLTSTSGYHPSNGQVVDSVLSAGIIAMTQALGIELASRRVRVVGVAVGCVAETVTNPEAGSADRRRTPMRRLGSAADVAEAAFFLASDEASYIMAETLTVDGGWSAYQMF